MQKETILRIMIFVLPMVTAMFDIKYSKRVRGPFMAKMSVGMLAGFAMYMGSYVVAFAVCGVFGYSLQIDIFEVVGISVPLSCWFALLQCFGVYVADRIFPSPLKESEHPV